MLQSNNSIQQFSQMEQTHLPRQDSKAQYISNNCNSSRGKNMRQRPQAAVGRTISNTQPSGRPSYPLGVGSCTAKKSHSFHLCIVSRGFKWGSKVWRTTLHIFKGSSAVEQQIISHLIKIHSFRFRYPFRRSHARPWQGWIEFCKLWRRGSWVVLNLAVKRAPQSISWNNP